MAICLTGSLKTSDISRTSRTAHQISVALKKKIEQLYLEESVIDPGKKKFKTINGNKMQVQYPRASIIDLLTKFCQDLGDTVAYSTFKKYKPINCMEPKLSERDTCACPKHTNFSFLVKAFHDERVISDNFVFQVMNACVCEERTTVYLSRQCTECQNKPINVGRDDIPLIEIINHPRWISKNEERMSGKTKKVITVSLTEEVIISNDIESPIQEFLVSLAMMMLHELRILHQGQGFKNTIRV
ncbi:hypothetical protein QAD02_018318 [Eretmocerus hayati]|uniref:Uncharacterized protein n=1 Tax=Eretmocerus hayati TaxID=131215 RepID=A0ACC2PI85_9HYME|nr:hypothetical protein QAD02_018318 [Eretmocerus hayati]